VVDIWGRIAGEAGKVVADAWTSIMLTVWAAGVYVLGVVLRFEDHFLTPDVSEAGPARVVLGYTFWIAAALVVVLLIMQLGAAAFRRDGKSLARAAAGVAQLGAVWVILLGYATLLLQACAAINDALMRALFGVDSWQAWQPWTTFQASDITDAVVATVLGVLGLVLWLAAIAHFVVILARAGALIVLTATAPIAAAGLVMESTRAWFWKSLRWFHAAAFAPLIMTLLMGLGVQITTGVALGYTDSSQAAVGTALPGVMMILIAAVAPAALFKLLAFVDPGTNTGAAVRAGLAAAGGLGGLFNRQPANDESGAASEADENGRARSETDSDTAASQRAMAAQADLADRLGPVGQALSSGLRTLGSGSAAAAAVGTDATNQIGVGHNTYQPDLTSSQPNPSTSSYPSSDDGADAAAGDDWPDQSGPTMPLPADLPRPPIGPAPTSGSAASGGAKTAGGEASAAEAAAVVI
jgi:type IV secretion system protein TrbL